MLQLKYRYTKKQNKDLADLNSLSKSNNILALFFSTVLLSIAGLPPMVGFLVKIGIFLVLVEASMYFIAIISILCSVISTFYYIRIIKIMYFESSIVGKLYYPIKSSVSNINSLFILFSTFFIYKSYIIVFDFTQGSIIVNYGNVVNIIIVIKLQMIFYIFCLFRN